MNLYQIEIKIAGREPFGWEVYTPFNSNLNHLDQMAIILRANENVKGIRIMEYALSEGKEINMSGYSLAE